MGNYSRSSGAWRAWEGGGNPTFFFCFSLIFGACLGANLKPFNTRGAGEGGGGTLPGVNHSRGIVNPSFPAPECSEGRRSSRSAGKIIPKKKNPGKEFGERSKLLIQRGTEPGGARGGPGAGSVWIEGHSWDLGRGWSWELLPLGFRGIQVEALSPLPIPSSHPKSRPWGASGALKSSRFRFLGRFAAPLRAGSLGFASGIPDFGTNPLNPEPSALWVGNPWIHPQRYSQ